MVHSKRCWDFNLGCLACGGDRSELVPTKDVEGRDDGPGEFSGCCGCGCGCGCSDDSVLPEDTTNME